MIQMIRMIGVYWVDSRVIPEGQFVKLVDMI